MVACSFTRGVLIVGSDGFFAYAMADTILWTAQRAPRETLAAGLVDLVRLPRQGFAEDTSVVVVAHV